MILFGFFVAVGAVLSNAIPKVFELNLLDRFVLAIFIFILFCYFSLVFSLLISMRLGKNHQDHLVKSSVDAVVYFDNTHFRTLNRLFSWDDVKQIDYTEETDEAYLITNRYNIGGWRRVLLWETEKDCIEYIFVQPIGSTEY